MSDADSTSTVAGCMLLSLALACDGLDTLSGVFRNRGHSMAKRLRLFDVVKSPKEVEQEEKLSSNERVWRAHVAWGAYNWLCLHSSYYGAQTAAQAPSFQVPV